MNIKLKVIPNARKREIILDGDDLKVKITAVPRDGKANDELIAFLAEIFKVRKSEIKILTGEKDRRKVVSVPVERIDFSIFKKKE